MEITPEERLDNVRHIVKLYETELASVIKVSDKFEVDRLPNIVQQGIKLVTAKSPGFSNISSCTTVNFVFNHLLGQLRPVINDAVYSPDQLSINYYAINISGSGSGKDASVTTMKSACSTAFQLIKVEREKQEEERAKRIALREKQKEVPNAVESDLVYSDYVDFIRELEDLEMGSKTTSGGLSSKLNRMATSEFGIPCVVMGEFGLALKSGKTTEEVLEMLGILYDMGNAPAPSYKTAEVREAAIESMYPNALLHSSPKIIFGDERVSETISMIFHAMMARRSWYTMPSEEENIENNEIPGTIAEVREIANRRRVVVSKTSTELDDMTTQVVARMLSSEANRVVSFAEDAAQLYTDYFQFGAMRAELAEDSSISQVEVAGRAFKTARLAALWTLMSGENEISKTHLASAIYFAEYNSKYMEKFVILTSSKAYRLLGDKFKEGKLTEVTLDTAMVNGWVTRVSNDFHELLHPMNSYLSKDGVVSYCNEARLFKYAPYKKVEDTGEYALSYNKVPGVPKADRVAYLDNFDHYKTGSMKFLENIVTNDTVYNVFRYNDGPNKNGDVITMNRNQKYIASSTKLLTIDVDKSEIDIVQMHNFLSEFKHIICTTSDRENKYKFRIILPVSVEIDGTQLNLYRCIMKSVCEELTIEGDPTSGNPAQPIYGYAGSEVYSNTTGRLYEIEELISQCANNPDEGLVPKTKPVTTQAKTKAMKDIMANVNKIFDYCIHCKAGAGSISLARASMHLRDQGANQEQYLQVIHYLNSCWTNPMDEVRLENTVLKTYLSQMEG